MFDTKRQKLAALSPEKRALLEARLLKKSSPAVAPLHEKVPVALSFAQKSLWFLDRLEPGSSFYNIPQAFRIVGPLNFEALRKSFQSIVDRHEVLLTQLVDQQGQPEPRLAQNPCFNLPIVDLRQLPEAQRKERASELIMEEGKRAFDLEKELMIRASLLRLSDEENVLLMSVHHIASDHWSFTVLYRELMEFYKIHNEGQPADLPPLKRQYSDFAMEESRFLQSDAAARHLDYWKKKLSGVLPELDFPTDYLRPKKQTFRGKRQLFSVAPDLATNLRNLSQNEGTTLFVTLLSAFQVLLFRYSDQTDLFVGSPFGARNQIENESLIGYFLNTLVLRTDLSGNPTFRELMQQNRTVALEAFTHGNIPLEKLVEELKLPHRTDRNPLFQVIFQYQPTPLPALTLQGTQSESVEIETGTSKMDIVFTISETENGLTGDIEYNTDLFAPETMQRFVKHYQCLLTSVAADPSRNISRLEILSSLDRQQLLDDGSKTQTDYPRDKTVAELFEKQANETPDAIALQFEGEQLTYRELNAKADRLAARLAQFQIQRNQMIGVALDRSLELIISLIAILKTGGAYVPLDPNLPEDRFRFIMEEADISLLITDKTIPFSNVRMIHPSCDSDAIPSSRSAAPQITPESPAYVMFTSGSTGKPKGVVVPHRAIVRLVKETHFMRFGRNEVFLQFAPVSFDASTLEIWGSLLNGAKLVIHPPDFPSLDELGQTLLKNEITVLWLTAGLFHQMVEYQLDSLRGIRQLLAGGDVLSVSHVQKVLQSLPDCQLINGYGPTENTTFTCCYSIPRDWTGRSVPIGTPISNTYVYILDKNLEPTPIGVPGELFIGGDGLALGYLNRPELDAEKFISNPFKPQERLYRSGDKVRYRSDGTIEFMGRFDHQVKIRGFRIELEEIETVLAEHPYVKNAVAVAVSKPDGEKFIAAYVALHDKEHSAESLKQFLRTKLPDYMVPSAIIPMDEFPLTQNGKVNRRALPAPDAYQQEPKDLVVPRTDTEAYLLNLWRDLLGRNHFGIKENFFELGGHSLLATQVASRISQKFQTHFPLQKIFEFPTIEELARALDDAPRQPTQSRPPLIKRPRRLHSATSSSSTIPNEISTRA